VARNIRVKQQDNEVEIEISGKSWMGLVRYAKKYFTMFCASEKVVILRRVGLELRNVGGGF